MHRRSRANGPIWLPNADLRDLSGLEEPLSSHEKEQLFSTISDLTVDGLSPELP